MQVKYVLFVIYCAVPLLLHVADSHEYCDFTITFASCTKHVINRTLNYVPIISQHILHIGLQAQPLKQLPRNAFRNVSSQNELESIHLFYCQIHHIDADAFENLDSLEFLNMTGNSISRFETGTFQHTKQLTELFMDYNKIEKLQTGLFHNLVHLKSISARHNRIACIDNNTFRNTPALFYINVEYNELEYLSPSFTDHFIKLAHLTLRDNPLNCDCNLREFYERNKVRKPVFDDTESICQNPPALRGRHIAELTSEAFTCDARIIFPKNDTRVVTLGSNVTLSCAVHGDPVSDIEWRRGSHIIARYDVLGSTTSNMHYLNYTFTVQEEDLGVYYCFVYNTDGVEKSSTTLTTNVTTK